MVTLYINNKKHNWIRKTVVFGALILILLPITTYALSRGYSSGDSGVQTGMVVSLSNEGADDQVERSTQENSHRIVGVVTTIEDSTVTISSGNSKLLVENSGQVDIYVSDINGEVSKGDLLILSPLKGILMKAPELNTSKVIGIATQSASELEQTVYQYKSGEETKDTKIAKIKTDISSLGGANSGAIASDSSLKTLGRAVAGREVSEMRVLIALVIFLVVLTAEGGILYGAISNSITALGRNPLAKKIIRSELYRVILVAIMVLLIGLASVYVILWI